jgi:hypothetical protein
MPSLRFAVGIVADPRRTGLGMTEKAGLGRAHDASAAVHYASTRRWRVAAMGASSTRIATRLLARDGIGAIWELHEAAASAQRAGHKWAAEIMIEIADAAEQIWRQRVVEGFGSASSS